VPVLVLIREILRVDTDDLATLVAVVGEHALVALDAVRVVVPQDVPVAGQAVIAVVAKHSLSPRLLLVSCRSVSSN